MHQHLKHVKKKQNIRDELYSQIESVASKIPKRDIVFIAGDFNAKVGSQRDGNPNNSLGQHGKGRINTSGEVLLELCIKTNYVWQTHFSNTSCVIVQLGRHQ